ncbi:RICIN domain-containing protein [Clostridium sp. Marseille-P2415]|uniref:RICIN domain-containing protein n=1 Tax=Clostridium sp. Marseille-P2415 TaxID=1805471 RepID=UPI0009885B37|nr:RICIN domain-containing protein [Clostridium sp. Marseille-P2415]
MRKIIKKAVAFVTAVVLASTGSFMSSSAIALAETGKRTFIHPGMLHTDESFEAMNEAINNKLYPNYDTWNALKSNGFSASDWQPREVETIIRDNSGSNCSAFYIDLRRAYQNALIWKLSGSKANGEAACRILNAWSAKTTNITGNADRYLAAGIYGYQLANVAEIMRDHPDFNKSSMDTLLLNVFYPKNNEFLTKHNDAHIGNYWANWDLCNIASMISIGIFTDREDIYNQAVDYFKTGLGNGSIYNCIPFVYDDGTAQWQESGRDQGHTTLGISLYGSICEMAWNQGDDLYSLSDNRFLKAAEYVAKYNNMEEVQYTPYEWLKGQKGNSDWMNSISADSRGSIRPVYSLIYNHYVKRMGLPAPNIEKVLNGRLEKEQSNGDELGWQSLTFANTGKATERKYIKGDFADGKYRIVSVLTGKSLVVNSNGELASADKGTKNEEIWRLENTGDGEYIVINQVTNKAIQISKDYYTKGSVAETGENTSALNQKFAFIKNSTGDYRIISSASDYSLCLSGAGQTDNTPVIQWRYLSQKEQRWILEKVQ